MTPDQRPDPDVAGRRSGGPDLAGADLAGADLAGAATTPPVVVAPVDLAGLRATYRRGRLDEADVDPDPVAQFRSWLAEAVAARVPEPNAMTLATADADGVPSARVVLLKEVDERGFVLYTNSGSRKGEEMAANPHAALVFCWLELERQVRVTGDVAPVTRDESAAYFAVRPRASQIGAWASAQSTPVGSRAELEDAERAVAARFAGGDVPLPDFWGGWRVRPRAVEFWQGRPSRLHDRLRYTRDGGADGPWRLTRLAP